MKEREEKERLDDENEEISQKTEREQEEKVNIWALSIEGPALNNRSSRKKTKKNEGREVINFSLVLWSKHFKRLHISWGKARLFH